MGRIGQIPWNKIGKYKNCLVCKKQFYATPSDTKIGKAKYCSLLCYYEARRGIPNTYLSKLYKGKNKEWLAKIRPNMQGANSPMWKGGLPNCIDCGRKLSLRSYKHCVVCSSKLHSGENHWNWKGGITPINVQIRNSTDFQKWRIAVFERDDFICQICNKKGGKLRANHIKTFAKYFELRFELSNGITICQDCDYRWVFRKEEEMESYFK